VIYLDASAIVKLVVVEPETDALRTWLGRRRSPRVTSDLTRVEVPRACMRAEPTALLEAQRAIARLSTVPLTRTLLAAAAALQPPGLRSLDAVHLASALALGTGLRAFVVYDDRLAAAARAHGLPVERPA
jgi:predicted nucleic acid-binding protein